MADAQDEDEEPGSRRSVGSWRRLALFAVPLILLLAVVGILIRDTTSPSAVVVVPPPTTEPRVQPTSVPPAAIAEETQPAPVMASIQPETPTPQPGGQVLGLTPLKGEVGWWTGGDAEGNYTSDSYLYAGFYQGNAFISAARFDIGEMERGAPIVEGSLRLTGLLADRFDPGAGGTWTVQLMPGGALPPLRQVDFQALLNAPAAVTLFPTLYPADLAVGQVNVLNLDESALAWLREQRAQGATEVVARIIGPGGGGDSLFAWDSGDGPATAGEPPRMLLSIGAPPPTVPPLPTNIVRVATLTPTPANLLTAAANAVEATKIAREAGSAQIIPVVTPTPIPENLATAQAQRFAQGLRPFVVFTLTPANGATATANALEATAVAVTTGTFTPVPVDAITPVIVLPTEIAENPATAAVQMLAATRQAADVGTVTPLPPDILIATRTATPFVIAAIPAPENQQTAVARSVLATAVAVTTGTFTPYPPNAVTATPTRPPTVAAQPQEELLLFLDRITPTPGPTAEGAIPAVLLNKIVYWSDRNGVKQSMAVDPASGRQAILTQDWLLRAAQSRELTSPNGRYTLTVAADALAYPQIYIHDNVAGDTRKLTDVNGGAFDPAFSPDGNRIAFASWQAGNEEIYLMNLDGSNVLRLTNHGDIDRHPSWSPNGSQIVFWSQRETGRRQLWIMNADGSNQRQLVSSAFDDYDPTWVR